jgi:YggT family protein
MGLFLEQIINGLLGLMILVIVLNVVMSWLIVFEVVNLRNQMARQLVEFLDALSRPILAPLRRFIPPIGGIDLTPFLAVLILGAAQNALVPWIFQPIRAMLGG